MEKKSLDEKERRKAEVRARLEAQAKKKKRGFMTPERKKRLRNLLRKKAAEELKKEQERKAEERKRAIIQRAGKPKSLEGNEATLQAVIRDYHKRIQQLESDKYDVELIVKFRDLEIKELADKVNNCRGKFDKPPLKKVSKMANQLEKIRMFAARASQANYRASLKQVAKKEYAMDDEKETKSKLEKPEWAERSNKNIPRLSKSESQPVSGAQSEVEEEEEDEE